MSFFFDNPLGFVLILTLIPLWLYWKKRLTTDPTWRSGMLLLLRCCVVLLVVLALAEPIVTWRNYIKYVVFVVDRSGSVAETDSPGQLAEAFIESACQTQGKHQHTNLFFGRNITPEASRCDPTATCLASALTAAVALTPEDYVPRVVLFSDGTCTEGALPATVAKEVPMDVVLMPTLPGEGRQELWIERIAAPPAGYEGQVVGVDVFIRARGVKSDETVQGDIQLSRNGQAVETQAVTFEQDGVRGVRFQAAVKSPSASPAKNKPQNAAPEAVLWSVKLAPHVAGQDVCEVNNTADAITQVVPHQRILLVERTPGFGRIIRETLKKQFITVETCTVEDMPQSADALADFGLVMLSNISAGSLTMPSQEALRTYVTRDGGGLVVIGGNQAFTSGGYHETPLEELLPVVCVENQAGKKREGLAMALVVDRSKSMEAGNAISLAREAVKKALDLLGEQDKAGVLAYADASFWVVPLKAMTDDNKREAFARVDDLPAISTTNMGPPMEKAFLALQETSADRKHIILMTDGISNPADFAEIARKTHAAGITISTVALGDEAEPNLLADIAALGGGKAHVCTDAESLPRIFAQETAEAARLGIVEGQTPVRQISSIPGFMNFDFTQVPPLLGYVQTRAKADSRVIFESPMSDPILAWWKCGHGKTVVFTSDMESHWVETWRSGWKDFDRFWSRLIHHAIRKNNTDGFHLRLVHEYDRLDVFVTLPPERQEVDFPGLEMQVHDTATGEHKPAVTLENVAPGLFMTRVKVKPETRYDLIIREKSEAFGAYSARLSTISGVSREYRPDAQNPALATLESISGNTLGRMNPQPAEIFAQNETGGDTPHVAQTLPFWPFFLFFAIIAWMAEIFLRRSPI